MMDASNPSLDFLHSYHGDNEGQKKGKCNDNFMVGLPNCSIGMKL